MDSSYIWFVTPLITLGLGMIFGATARSGLIMSRMPRSLPALANALNLAAMELGAILGSTVMTVLMMRSATERYEELLVEEAVETSTLEAAVEGFRDALRTVTPGGSTIMEPSRVEGLLPGFREAMADGLSWSLWLVTSVTVVATVVAWAGFHWARRRDDLPDAPIQPDPKAEIVSRKGPGPRGRGVGRRRRGSATCPPHRWARSQARRSICPARRSGPRTAPPGRASACAC